MSSFFIVDNLYPGFSFNFSFDCSMITNIVYPKVWGVLLSWSLALKRRTLTSAIPAGSTNAVMTWFPK